MPNNYICNLVIPGAAKSGTSSLHSVLAQHPQVCMSNPKEPQFFSFYKRSQGDANAHNRLFATTKGKKVFGESSQCYFVDDDAVRNISECLSDPKIIIVLRDPVDRLISHYRFNFNRGVEKLSLECALSEKGENSSYKFIPSINMYSEIGGYIAFSRYTRWVPMWQEAFGAENVLLITFDELKASQARVAKRCFTFLDLDASFEPSYRKGNSTSNVIPNPPTTLKSLARLLPTSLKETSVYSNARAKLFQILADRRGEPDKSFADQTVAQIREELKHDITFYQQLVSH